MQLTGTTKEEKMKNAIMLYADIEKWYADFWKQKKEKNVLVSLTKCCLITKEYQK